MTGQALHFYFSPSSSPGSRSRPPLAPKLSLAIQNQLRHTNKQLCAPNNNMLATKSLRCHTASRPAASRRATVSVRAFQVTLETPKGERKFQCQNTDSSLLEAALASGVTDLPHLCRTGTCGVCAARVLSGSVERDDLLLDDLQADAGFVLLCTTKPTSDVSLRTEQEKELHTIPYNL